jgi:hypothetical protein
MKKLVRSLSRSLASVPSLLAVGTAGLLAVALHSWPIAVLGVATSAALAAADVAKKKSALPESPLPSPARIADPHTAGAVRAILDARKQLERALTSTDAVATMLAPVADLEARAAKLARRAEEIAMHLNGVDFAALKREVDHLGTRIPSTPDPTTRASYVAALEARQGHLATLTELVRTARQGHLATLTELVRTKERIGATLLSIAATLDALPAKVVRLRGLDDASNDVGRDLRQMNEEIASFEETLLHIHGVT